MRIISGEYKGRRIMPPSNLPVRPTTDMAKEALFNILNNILDYEDVKSLDLFAGVGNISFELISRGCLSVLSVDSNVNCVKFIRQAADSFGMNGLMTVRADVFNFIKQSKVKFDFIFADPPYDNLGINDLPALIFDNNLLNTDGLLVLEHPFSCNFETDIHFFDHRVYSRVNFSFFRSKD